MEYFVDFYKDVDLNEEPTTIEVDGELNDVIAKVKELLTIMSDDIKFAYVVEILEDGEADIVEELFK